MDDVVVSRARQKFEWKNNQLVDISKPLLQKRKRASQPSKDIARGDMPDADISR